MAMNPRLLRPLASGFSPRQIAGLAGWWDASDEATVSTVSGAVSQLDDKSGLGRHATQGTAASRPLYSGAINGRNVMTMDGTNDFLVTGLESATLTGYATMFCVAQASSTLTAATATNKTPLFGRDSNAANSYGLVLHNAATGLGLNFQWRHAGYNYINPPLTAIGTPLVLAGGSDSGKVIRRVSGYANDDVRALTAGTNSAAGNYLHIGLDPTQNRYWTDLWAEALVYDRTLTTSEIQRVEGYLAWKWGLQSKLPYDHPYARSFPGYGSQTTPTDPDAQTYLAAVSAADGTGVEVGVANAVDDFVKGCKSDGIWDAIKASCILAGARTLAGALVPLKGAAPTPYNFAAGDYSRETGLAGNGSTKYLYQTTASGPTNTNHSYSTYITEKPANPNPAQSLLNAANITGSFHLLTSANFRSAANQDTHSVAASLGLWGCDRSLSTEYRQRHAGVTDTKTRTANAQTYGELYVFTGWTAASNFSTHRIAFYHFGESLDLEALDTRVSALITAIGAAI